MSNYFTNLITLDLPLRPDNPLLEILACPGYPLGPGEPLRPASPGEPLGPSLPGIPGSPSIPGQPGSPGSPFRLGRPREFNKSL